MIIYVNIIIIVINLLTCSIPLCDKSQGDFDKLTPVFFIIFTSKNWPHYQSHKKLIALAHAFRACALVRVFALLILINNSIVEVLKTFFFVPVSVHLLSVQRLLLL